MDFLGLGPLEILVILIVGFLLLGPEKLPGMLARAGEWYRKLTKASTNIAKSLTEELSADVKSKPGETRSVTETNRAKTGEAKAVSEMTGPPVQEISPETGKTTSLSDEKTGE